MNGLINQRLAPWFEEWFSVKFSAFSLQTEKTLGLGCVHIEMCLVLSWWISIQHILICEHGDQLGPRSANYNLALVEIAAGLEVVPWKLCCVYYLLSEESLTISVTKIVFRELYLLLICKNQWILLLKKYQTRRVFFILLYFKRRKKTGRIGGNFNCGVCLVAIHFFMEDLLGGVGANEGASLFYSKKFCTSDVCKSCWLRVNDGLCSKTFTVLLQ